MDFPEVWQFKQKHKALHHETFVSTDTVAAKISSKLPVAKMISILTPKADTAELENIIIDSDYYTCEDFKLSEILAKNFIDGFLKSGVFSCEPTDYSFGSDTFSIACNKLNLHLHKDSLNSIHCVELSSLKSRIDGEYSNYNIDLLSERIDFTKLKDELKDLFDGTSVNFMWNPTSDDICSSSIAKHFSDSGHQIKLCKNKILTQQEFGLTFPKIESDADADRFAKTSEYIGMVLLGCSVEENDFSSYHLPDDCVDVGRGAVMHSKGFFTQHSIQRLINEIRKISAANLSFPWIALSIIFNSSPPETNSKLLIIANDKIHSVV